MSPGCLIKTLKTMEKHHKRAKEIFTDYTQNTIYFTSDGLAFFSQNPADIHAKTLSDKLITTIERHEVMEPEVDDSDVENDEEEVILTDEQKLANLKAIPVEQLTSQQKGQITKLENKAKKDQTPPVPPVQE